jgi:hypothetical protein
MDLTSRVALEDVGGNLDYNARPPDLFRRTIAWSREATSTFRLWAIRYLYVVTILLLS